MVNRMLAVLYVVYILLCFEVGLLLLFFPWLSAWTKNFFVDHYPWVSSLARNGFVRGAVSGLGLADIWLGIYEIWRLRQRSSPAAGSGLPKGGLGS